jgi:hypothetical protein
MLSILAAPRCLFLLLILLATCFHGVQSSGIFTVNVLPAVVLNPGDNFDLDLFDYVTAKYRADFSAASYVYQIIPTLSNEFLTFGAGLKLEGTAPPEETWNAANYLTLVTLNATDKYVNKDALSFLIVVNPPWHSESGFVTLMKLVVWALLFSIGGFFLVMMCGALLEAYKGSVSKFAGPDLELGIVRSDGNTQASAANEASPEPSSQHPSVSQANVHEDGVSNVKGRSSSRDKNRPAKHSESESAAARSGESYNPFADVNKMIDDMLEEQAVEDARLKGDSKVVEDCSSGESYYYEVEDMEDSDSNHSTVGETDTKPASASAYESPREIVADKEQDP